jgi:uncharacterized protein (TIGR02145 family)
MKTITNYLKRTCFSKVAVAFLICLFSLTIPSCQKDNADRAFSPDSYLKPSSDSHKKDKPKPKYGRIIDVERNVYKTVQIGDQWWMAENLKSTKYNDRRAIPNIKDNTEWINLSTEAYCYYNNDISYKCTYGTLYNWYSVRNGSLCPTGWHVPSDMEWVTLINFLGGESVAGAKLKQTGTDLWLYPNSGATNESGFTALPSGDRIGADGSFYNLNGYAIYWTSDEATFSLAINRVLVFDDTNFRIGYDNKTAGFSVRCVKD